MTYGEVSARLRDQLTLLLERHRIQARIGGAGSFHVPATTTHEEREQLGAEMQRYRTAVLDYCRQAISTADPGLRVATRRRAPVADLLFRLEKAAAASKRDLPLSDLLSGKPEFDHVRTWQSLAREAVVGERELAALKWRIVPEQARVIFKDAADLVRGIVAVDVRHRGVPGWEQIMGESRLLTAAETVSAELSGQPLDHAVDGLGWRPRPGVIEGPALPGLAGVIQAQHNVVVDLQHFPSATNLRTVLVSQADLSRNAARLAEALEPSLAANLNERATLYRDLAQESRTVGGEAGGGGSPPLRAPTRHVAFAVDQPMVRKLVRCCAASHTSPSESMGASQPPSSTAFSRGCTSSPSSSPASTRNLAVVLSNRCRSGSPHRHRLRQNFLRS